MLAVVTPAHVAEFVRVAYAQADTTLTAVGRLAHVPFLAMLACVSRAALAFVLKLLCWYAFASIQTWTHTLKASVRYFSALFTLLRVSIEQPAARTVFNYKLVIQANNVLVYSKGVPMFASIFGRFVGAQVAFYFVFLINKLKEY